MTKLRPPLSTEQALSRIAGQLPGGFEAMAEKVGKSASLLRKYGDPDREEEITVRDARTLDLAFRAAGGEGYPLYDAYTAQLEIAELQTFSDRFALLDRAGKVIKEGGEAHAALIAACKPGATQRDRDNAARELAEALEEIKPTLAALGVSIAANERAPP